MDTSIFNRLKDLLTLTQETTKRLNAEIKQGIARPNVPILLAEMNECQSFLDSLTEQQKKDYAPFVEIIEMFQRVSTCYATTWIAMSK